MACEVHELLLGVRCVATRVSARAFEYDSSPLCIIPLKRGRSSRARATRTFSRAGPIAMPVRQLSQWAHVLKPVCQPPLWSNSRISTKRR